MPEIRLELFLESEPLGYEAFEQSNIAEGVQVVEANGQLHP